MKRNMMEWTDNLITAKQKQGFLILSFPAIQKMGITVKELIFSSELQAEAMKIVAESTPDAIASISLMDLSVEAEAFGSDVLFFDHEVPTVVGSVVSTQKEAEALRIPDIGDGRTGVYVDTIKKAVQHIEDRPVFASVIGPFSLAGRLLNVTEAMLYCYDKPAMVHTVLEKVTEFLIKYIMAYKEAGANGVFIAEPLGGILSPAHSKEFSSQYVKKIVAATQTEDFIVAYHNCGNGTIQQIDTIVENGCRILHFGNAIDMKEILLHIPEDIICMGNIDPAGEFRNGTPESLKAATLHLLENCSHYPNFIVSSGCDIPPLSGWENIEAFFTGIHEYYD